MISWNSVASPYFRLFLAGSATSRKPSLHPSAQEITGGTLRDSEQRFDIATGDDFVLAKQLQCRALARVEPTQRRRAVLGPASGSLSRALLNILEALRHAVAEVLQPLRDIGFRPPLVVVVRRADGEGCVIGAKVAGIVLFQ